MICRCLPSSDSALALVNGESGALSKVILHTLGRAALISIGVYATGQRKNVIKSSISAACVIEVFAILYFSVTKEKDA